MNYIKVLAAIVTILNSMATATHNKLFTAAVMGIKKVQSQYNSAAKATLVNHQAEDARYAKQVAKLNTKNQTLDAIINP
jgi:hypothetical protein